MHAATPRTFQSSSKQPVRSWVSVVAFALALLTLALLLTACSSGETGKAEAASQQVAPVQVTGTPLPPLSEAASSGLADPATDPAIGLVAPKLDGKSFDLSEVSIDPADGRAKVVVFVAHWCPHCQVEVPIIKKWIADGNQPEDVDIYTVSTAASAERPNYPPQKWLDKAGWQPEVLIDSQTGDAFNAYGGTGFPYFVMLDSSGKVVQRASGEIPVGVFDDLVNSLR